MKNITLFIFCVLFALNSQSSKAQTLPNSVMPAVGDVIVTQVGDTTGIDEGPAGTNVIWDFTNLQAMTGIAPTSATFATASSTPHADQFPEANLAVVSGVGMGTTVYSYYKKEGQSLEYLGGETAGVFTFMTIDPQLVLRTGISIGQPINDAFAGFSESIAGTTYTNGEQIIEVDAAGTLKMPTADYSNAIRVRTITSRTDSINTSGVIGLTKLQITTYSWYIPGQADPAMTITYTEGEVESIVPGIPPSVFPIDRSKSIAYNPEIEIMTTNIQAPKPSTELIQLSPNPTNGPIHLVLERLSTGPVQIGISDMQGRQLSQWTAQLATGQHQIPLDVSDLPAGQYILSILDKDAIQSYRLMKN
ncbi:MAG: T9SS type A sorting domain-containing protein [Bacteroidota bacterium]